MLRLIYILLFAFLSLALDKSAEEVMSTDVARVELSAQDNAEQLWCCRECNSDMLRTMRTATPTIAQNSTSIIQQVRHRLDEQLKFYKERSSEINDLVKRGDFTTLQALPEDGVSAVTVVLYTSPRSSFTVAQVFEYEEMEMRPTSDLVMKA